MREYILPLHQQGKTISEISDLLGCSDEEVIATINANRMVAESKFVAEFSKQLDEGDD